MKSLALILIAVLTASCATSDHYNAQREQIAAWERVEIAKAQANARRHDALVAAATGGSDGVRIAAIFAAAGLGGNNVFPSQLPAVTDPNEAVYKWASLILPTATAITAGYFGYKLGTTQSDNAAATSIAGYGTMGGIAGAGFASNATIAGFVQAPAANITTTTSNTTTSTLSGTGVLGSGSYAVRNCNGGSASYTTTGNPLAAGGNC
jgi:hypothetical protein